MSSFDDLLFAVITNPKSILYDAFMGELNNNFPDLTTNNIVKFNNANTLLLELKTYLENNKNKFIIVQSDDTIFYDIVDTDMVSYYMEILKANVQYNFIKLIRAEETVFPLNKFTEGLFQIHEQNKSKFSFMITLWKTNKLLEIITTYLQGYQDTQSFNEFANIYCTQMNVAGLFAFNPESDMKRGLYHWDNSKYPLICGVFNRGMLNTSEYPEQLYELQRTYGL